jgi:hypothetical protein
MPRFRFLMGKALSSVALKSLGSVEFGEKDDVTVTLRDGKKATGIMRQVGWNGPQEMPGRVASSGQLRVQNSVFRRASRRGAGVCQKSTGPLRCQNRKPEPWTQEEHVSQMPGVGWMLTAFCS